MASNSAAALVTQQSIKAYVDAQVTASDLDFAGDSGGAQSVDLDSQTFTIAGTTNEIETSGSGQTLTVGLPNDVTIGQDLTVTRNVSIADSIFHTGDTNTALRFPSADTITATTAGSERLRVTSTGLVGINTTPGTLLEIQGASGKEATVTFNREGVQSSNDGVIGEFLFENATDSVALLAVKRESAADDAYIQVATQAAGDGLTEKLRITANGRVNIGSASDVDHTLCVAGTDNTTGLTGGHNQGIQLQNKSTTDGTYSQIEWRTAAGGRCARIAGIQDDANGNGGQLAFLTENTSGALTERLRIRSDGGVVATGIATFSSTKHLTVPVGTTVQRDSIVANGMIRYNTTLNSYEGYGNGAWGGLGGGTEIDTAVSSISATNITTFAHASYRSAQLRVQITQGSAYQVGKYLLIHDGTTVTIVEESAIATGDMLGNVSSVINGSNVEVKITMNSASSATVTTIIDKITV